MRTAPIVVIAALIVSACASAHVRAPGSFSAVSGQYSVRTQTQSFVLAGQLVVADNDVSLTLERTWCRQLDVVQNGPVVRFTCNPIDGLTSLMVDVDATNLVHSSRWSGTLTRQRSVKTCVATAIVNGREVCTSYQNLSEEYQASVSGPLIVTAAGKAP